MAEPLTLAASKLDAADHQILADEVTKILGAAVAVSSLLSGQTRIGFLQRIMAQFWQLLAT